MHAIVIIDFEKYFFITIPFFWILE